MEGRILTKQEFAERIARAQAEIVKTDLDAVLVFSTESEPAGVRYFSDTGRVLKLPACAFRGKGSPH